MLLTVDGYTVWRPLNFVQCECRILEYDVRKKRRKKTCAHAVRRFVLIRSARTERLESLAFERTNSHKMYVNMPVLSSILANIVGYISRLKLMLTVEKDNAFFQYQCTTKDKFDYLFLFDSIPFIPEHSTNRTIPKP